MKNNKYFPLRIQQVRDAYLTISQPIDNTPSEYQINPKWKPHPHFFQ